MSEKVAPMSEKVAVKKIADVISINKGRQYRRVYTNGRLMAAEERFMKALEDLRKFEEQLRAGEDNGKA